jgi:hypothetical protein
VRYLQDFIRECAYAGIPDSAVRQMVQGNAWRLLHPEAK